MSREQGRDREQTESWTVGGTTLTAVVEAETSGVPVEMFFPDATADHVTGVDWLPEGAARSDGTIAFRIQAFVVTHRAKLIVVDPCVGNCKARSMPFWNDLRRPWMDRFMAAGSIRQTSISSSTPTHHEDHFFGWDTRLVDGVWVPTFPNARHVYVGNELSWAETPDRRTNQDPFADSITPVIDAGLGWEVGNSADLGDGLTLVPTPGHTPGHVSLRIETSLEPIVITGDVLHHPLQFADPSIAEIGDWDVGMARRTRTDFFDEHARAGTLLAGTHFPVAPVGRVEVNEGAWRFVAEPPA